MTAASNDTGRTLRPRSRAGPGVAPTAILPPRLRRGSAPPAPRRAAWATSVSSRKFVSSLGSGWAWLGPHVQQAGTDVPALDGWFQARPDAARLPPNLRIGALGAPAHRRRSGGEQLARTLDQRAVVGEFAHRAIQRAGGD